MKRENWQNYAFLILLLAIFAAFLCCGCTTVIDRPEQLRSIRREISRCNDDLNNAVQILTYCARMTPNADLANLSLDGVLKIIGEPSPEERVFAVSLDAAGIGDVTSGAETIISHRDKLLRSESTAESALARDFHRHARSSATLSLIKWLSISAIGLFTVLAIVRHIIQ